MLTYEQKKIFATAIVLIMLVPMIIVGMVIRIKTDIYNRKCPAIREVGEFQKVFNECASAYGLSIDLSEAHWRDSGYYHAKTVPVHGSDELYCTVVGNYESNGAMVMSVEFCGEYEAKEDAETEHLSKMLESCFQIFAPKVYGQHDYMRHAEDRSFIEMMDIVTKTWSRASAEYKEAFLSDHRESENIRVYSRVTEEGKYQKMFIWF